MCRRLVLLAVACVLGLACPIRADLVGHWTFDEGEGTTAYDSSGSGYHGTLQGDPQWVAGKIGGALEFDGAGDYVEVPDDEGLHLWERFTLAAWIYQLESRSSRIVDKIGAGTANGPHLDTHPGTRLRCCSGACVSTTADHTLEEWHHVAVTFDEGDIKIYLDGAVAAAGIAPSPLAGNTLPLRIGAASDGDSLFHGIIDDVRVYNHALTEAEVLGAMAGGARYPYAVARSPKNNSMVDATSAQLSWGAGAFAASHDVYFGANLEDVNQATPASDSFQGNQTATEFSAQNLTPGSTYYWRVDEVNDANTASPWKGEVWSFWVRPATAWDPSPADGANYVLTDQVLTWGAGMNALFHTVYFGEDFDEVNDATFSPLMMTNPTYAPDQLELSKTYYWRVDEFVAGSAAIKGDVWSFTTLPPVPVADDPNLALWYTLDEGSGATAVDWSGHEHHGAIFGQAQWIDGALGGALDFDGLSTGIDMDDRIAETTFTLALWLKPRDIPYTSGYYALSHNDLWNAGSVHVHLMANTSAFYVGFNAGGEPISSTTALRPDEWWHLAASVDATDGAKNLYVNGVLEATEADATGTPYIGPLNFGAWTNNQRFYLGAMDDIRVYDDVLTEDEIQQLIRGNPLQAGHPNPGRNVIVDIRNATSLSWEAGATAVSHDVYFGTDRDALEFQGNQAGSSFSLVDRVEFGGGDYYWRIDEVEADGTVHEGDVWTFTVPDHLIVDDFENYTNDVGRRVFEKWVDGIGFTQPEPGDPGNGTGALVGHDIWAGPYTNLMETANVNSGALAMPVYYDNTSAPGYSEADRTFTPAQNWGAEGVTTLVVHFRGATGNTGQLYVLINGTKVPYEGDPTDIASRGWVKWPIDLASVAANVMNITTLAIGIEGGETGVLYIDDIILTRP